MSPAIVSRNKRIRERYNELLPQVVIIGKVYRMLKAEFHLGEGTIRQIIFRLGSYREAEKRPDVHQAQV